MSSCCSATRTTCSNVTNQELQCTKNNNNLLWQLVDKNEALQPAQCPSNSIPWEMQAVCNLQPNSRKCFSTSYGAVCLQSNTNSSITKEGMKLLKHGFNVSFSKPLKEKDIEGLVPCYSQNFSGMSNTQLLTFVGKSKGTMCENITKLAEQNEFSKCIQNSNNCAKTVKSHFDEFHPKKTQYTCSLNVSELPYATSNDAKWWDWYRKNEQKSIDNEWKITVDENTPSNGEKCEVHSECKSTFETGVCKRGTCIKGAVNSRCISDENCDLYKGSEGKCSGGKCVSGKTNIYATYLAPTACSIETNGKSKYSYCGKIQQDGVASYTGVCTEYKNKRNDTNYACKAFTSKKEIERYKNEELDWMSTQKLDNFSGQLNNWERLNVCPENFQQDINGQKICVATRSQVTLTQDMEAASVENAAKKCSIKACDKSCPSEICSINKQTRKCEAKQQNKMHVEKGKAPPNGCTL